MRDTKDFELYTDLRLAGVGMVGVIHSTSAIEELTIRY
jgi:ATPase